MEVGHDWEEVMGSDVCAFLLEFFGLYSRHLLMLSALCLILLGAVESC